VSEGLAKKKLGVNRRLKPILQRGGGAGSHTLPNHVIRKWTVNMTLAKGHHAETRRTARNSLIFSHKSSTPINYTLISFDWGRRLQPGSILGDTGRYIKRTEVKRNVKTPKTGGDKKEKE
jgi:hypothetical protein